MVGGEGLHGRSRIGGEHQRLPHQHRAAAGFGEARRFGRTLDAGLGHRHDTGGDHGSQAASPGPVHLEGHQVALVHADKVGARRQRSLELSLIMNLN